MLLFKNPGLIDIDAAVTLGVNAKETDTPFGQFGTGMKYAIAVVLRLGGAVTVFRGHERYDFRVKQKRIRNTDVGFITMNGERLGFTTHLGKNWEPWQAYREFFCNAVDEGGGAERDNVMAGSENETRVYVTGLQEFDAVHDRRNNFILEDKPDVITDHGEIRRRPGKSLYYRGVLVHEFKHPAQFTYNVTSFLHLTEDRTLKYEWEALWAIERMVEQMPDDIMDAVMCAPKETAEHAIDFDLSHTRTKEFYDGVARNMATRKDELNSGAVKAFEREYREHPKALETFEPSEQQKKDFDQAMEFLAEVIGPSCPNAPIKFSKSIRGREHMAVINREIHLSQALLESGPRQIVRCIIEAVGEIEEDRNWESVKASDWLADLVVALGEKVSFELERRT